MIPIKTRFPPEPNGYLHLGHLKAMENDFNHHPNTECILRLDDTNPDAEKQEYVDSIIYDVKWLGYKPIKITYTSDYFDMIYNCAVGLIKKELAYMDHQSSEEIKNQRNNEMESPYRNQSIEKNLEEFEMMKEGKFPNSVLRLKIDMKSKNPNMRDFVAYRNKSSCHYRTGNKWKIYPTYDFSHCLVDSIEKIDYSYCTLEFETRRELYYWILDKLNMHKPTVYEFARLDIEKSVLSKRKIKEMIASGDILGYNDPRLLTIQGLRNAGYTPDILLKFIRELDGLMSKNQSVVPIEKLRGTARDLLNERAIRAFAVKDPILITITNLSKDSIITKPNHPTKDLGNHQMVLSNEIYIEKTDWKDIDSKDFYGLAPSKIVRLRHGPFMRCVSFENNNILCEIVDPEKDNFNSKKIKGCIHWVSKNSSKEIEIWDIDDLVDSNNQLNRDSLIKYKGFIENYGNFAINNYELQFERLGYYKYDESFNSWIQIAKFKSKY